MASFCLCFRIVDSHCSCKLPDGVGSLDHPLTWAYFSLLTIFFKIIGKEPNAEKGAKSTMK